MRVQPRRTVSLSFYLLVAVIAASFIIGFATAASADLRLPSSPIGQPPVLTMRIARVTRIPRPVPVSVPARAAPAPAAPASARCGGSLPTCGVMACESGGDIRVRNRAGSSASGKWQIIRSTWNGYGGYAEARDAPEHVQDAKARELWAGGAGASHWRSCL